MRIGQLARKYNINQDQVILFLNEAEAELSPFRHNSKVSSDIEALVIDHFSVSLEMIEETKEEEHIEVVPAMADEHISEVIEIIDNKKSEADLQRELDPTLPAIQTSVIEKKEEEPDQNSIDTDTLIQLLEDDEASNDLSKITHIKAPKKELSGLKVVGKIELAEQKIEMIEKSENHDKETKPKADNRPKRQHLNEEEKDKRRRQIKEQKVQYEARQEKRRIAGEKKKRKAQNKSHYDKKIQKSKAVRTKQKIEKEEIVLEANSQTQAFKPITIFDRFWRLFNL